MLDRLLFLLPLLMVACLSCEIDLSNQRLRRSSLQTALQRATSRTGCLANQATVLDLSENRLRSFPAGFFGQFPNLIHLDLEHNKLCSISTGFFSSLRNLKYLELDNNRFSTLRVGVFTGLLNLEELDLESNRLRSLPLGIFASLPRLRYLDLENNRLTTLPLGLFDHNLELEELDLEENRLTSLPLSLVAANAALFEFDISENRFRSQPAFVFHPNAAPTVTVTFEPQRRGREGAAGEEWDQDEEDEVSGSATVGLAVAVTLPALASAAFFCWRKARTPSTDLELTQTSTYTVLDEAQGGKMMASSHLLDANHGQEEALHAIESDLA